MNNKNLDIRQHLPDGFPKIVCLCGSTRFMQQFFDMGWELSLAGQIVLSVGVCKHVGPEGHGGEALGQDVADKLDELHKRKIDLADWVIVLNVGGYIGESTRAEIEHASSAIGGDPMEFRLFGCGISLRQEQARSFQIAPVAAGD